ncbi:MAG TPA: hypothetical protein EYG33_07770 [Candidatus Poseidoniales archaeon]|jgi:UMF1 family MFS transporter|nr:hypothetical protein [Candidatus Poseidoniales archaeon]
MNSISVKETINQMAPEEKRALRGWYLYDWANQAFAFTVMVVIAPALMGSLFNQATGGESDFFGFRVTGDSFYAIVLMVSMGVVAITSPALGIIADRMPIKKKLLKWYTVVGVLFTALMGAAPYFGSNGYLILAMMYVIAAIGFAGGNVFYYAFMPYLAEKRCMDHVSSWGYAYGYMGGSLLLLMHLGILLASPWEINFKLSVIFVTSSLWWWGFGALLFKWTPEPEIPSEMEWEGFRKAAIFAYSEVAKTFTEIKKFRILTLYLVAYLLFFDGVNTIASMASVFGEVVLRLDEKMNIVLLLLVSTIAIPMSLVFGKLADYKGTKFALILALLIYCFVGVTAAGFAPLELEGEEDTNRYDFTFTWNEEAQMYEMDTLYERGYEGWISEEGTGDTVFRENFQPYFPTPDYSETSSSKSSIGNGLLACILIVVVTGCLGAGMMYIQSRQMGWLGLALCFILVGGSIFATSLLTDKTALSEGDTTNSIDAENATLMIANFEDTEDHRFSILFIGGEDNISGMDEVGERHPTNVDQGGPIDWWPTTLRKYVWKPLGLGVNLQWMILGIFVGCAIGAAGAQARSMFTRLIPETRTTEFFGFFGFIGKAAAMIGPFLYALAVSQFDSRVALLTIAIVILLGTLLASCVNLEEGERVAAMEDARIRGEVFAEE